MKKQKFGTIEKSSRLIVKNLPPNQDERSLKELFSTYGEVTDCKIMFRNNTNRRFAFIGFKTVEEAVNAQEKMNQSMLKNFKIIVEFSALKLNPIQTKNQDENEEYENKRLFIKNLPYDVNEEDIEKLFRKYGEINEVKILRTREGRGIGSGFISFEDQNSSILALDKLNNFIFQGRILHVSRCKKQGESKFNKDDIKQKMIEEQKSSFKKIQKGRVFERLKDQSNWNSLFLNPNTVIELMAQKLGISKKDLLDNEIENPAQVQAIIEHEILDEVKEFLFKNNMNIKAFEKTPGETPRSQKIILVKNLSFDTKKQKLKEIFQNYGNVFDILIPNNKALAIVIFNSIEDAKNAFEILQGFLVNKQPMYLEWAPENLFTNEELLQKKQIQDEEQIDKSNTVFVKNLNFKSTEEDLENFLKKKEIKGIKSIKIVRVNGKSQGFGFIEFENPEQAMTVIKNIQNQIFDNHLLQLSMSKQSEKKNTQVEKKVKKSTKIILKNIAFQATKQELKELLKDLVDVKNLRFPKKLDNTPKGYAFLEMKTLEESEKAIETLQNLHFYGRKIVPEYANEQLIHFILS